MADPILMSLVANERYFEVLIICLIIILESVFIDVNRCTKNFDIASMSFIYARYPTLALWSVKTRLADRRDF